MIREIRLFDDPILRQKTKKVKKIDDKIISLIADMKETMVKCDALGLAANQIGEEVSLFLVRQVQSEGDNFLVVINPRIIKEEGRIEREEGCLSLPGLEEVISRPGLVIVAGLNEKGEEKRFEFSGILARAAKHEIDHLAGKLFIDYLSPIRLRFIEAKLAAIKREQMAKR